MNPVYPRNVAMNPVYPRNIARFHPTDGGPDASSRSLHPAVLVRVFLAVSLWLAPRAASAQPGHCTDTSPLLQRALAEVNIPPTGAAVDLLVSQAIQNSCEGASRWLPSTCGSPLGQQALVELRRRLFLDVVALLQRTISEPSGPGEQGLLAVVLLSAVLTSSDIQGLAWTLDRSSRGSLPTCRRDKEIDLEPLATARESLRAAAALLSRLSAETGGEPLAGLVHDLETRQGGPLKAETHKQLEQLVRAARALRAPPPSQDASSTVERARALGQALVLSVQITSRRSVDLPPRIFALIEHLARGQLDALITEALAMTTKASPLPPSVVETVRLVLALAEARSEAEVRSKLRVLLLPWSAPWLFDINASVPRLEGREGGSLLSLFGDLSLGYQRERWGTVGRGMFSLYNLRQFPALQRNYRALGDAEGWANFALSRSLKAEVRLSVGVTTYGTRHDDLTRSTFRLDRETSVVARGTVLGALRATPASTLAIGLWLGLGGQYEDYRSRALASLADRGFTDQNATSKLFESRLRLQWGVIPGWLGLRARADLVRFSITRDASNLTINAQINTTTTRTTATQLDLNTRLFLDLDALGFFGFLPSAHVGLDLYQQMADGQILNSTVPLAGLGLRRDTF